jgi:hypothetical protein
MIRALPAFFKFFPHCKGIALMWSGLHWKEKRSCTRSREECEDL